MSFLHCGAELLALLAMQALGVGLFRALRSMQANARPALRASSLPSPAATPLPMAIIAAAATAIVFIEIICAAPCFIFVLTSVDRLCVPRPHLGRPGYETSQGPNWLALWLSSSRATGRTYSSVRRCWRRLAVAALKCRTVPGGAFICCGIANLYLPACQLHRKRLSKNHRGRVLRAASPANLRRRPWKPTPARPASAKRPSPDFAPIDSFGEPAAGARFPTLPALRQSGPRPPMGGESLTESLTALLTKPAGALRPRQRTARRASR